MCSKECVWGCTLVTAVVCLCWPSTFVCIPNRVVLQCGGKVVMQWCRSVWTSQPSSNTPSSYSSQMTTMRWMQWRCRHEQTCWLGQVVGSVCSALCVASHSVISTQTNTHTSTHWQVHTYTLACIHVRTYCVCMHMQQYCYAYPVSTHLM